MTYPTYVYLTVIRTTAVLIQVGAYYSLVKYYKNGLEVTEFLENEEIDFDYIPGIGHDIE